MPLWFGVILKSSYCILPARAISSSCSCTGFCHPVLSNIDKNIRPGKNFRYPILWKNSLRNRDKSIWLQSTYMKLSKTYIRETKESSVLLYSSRNQTGWLSEKEKRDKGTNSIKKKKKEKKKEEKSGLSVG